MCVSVSTFKKTIHLSIAKKLFFLEPFRRSFPSPLIPLPINHQKCYVYDHCIQTQSYNKHLAYLELVLGLRLCVIHNTKVISPIIFYWRVKTTKLFIDTNSCYRLPDTLRYRISINVQNDLFPTFPASWFSSTTQCIKHEQYENLVIFAHWKVGWNFLADLFSIQWLWQFGWNSLLFEHNFFPVQIFKELKTWNPKN